MAKSEYTFAGSVLEEWLTTYLKKNGNIAKDSAKVKTFVTELYDKIVNDFDMISLEDGSQGVLYAGWYSDIAMWQIVDGITEQSDTYCYISDTAAGMLMGKEKVGFQTLLTKIIGERNVDNIFNSTDKYCSAIVYMIKNDHSKG